MGTGSYHHRNITSLLLMKKLTLTSLLVIFSSVTVMGLAAEKQTAPAYPEPKMPWLKEKISAEKTEIMVVECEDVLVNKDMIATTSTAGMWTFFSEEGGTWSGGRTLRGEKIFKNRSPLDPESAILHFRIPVEKGFKYTIRANGGRTYGISLDGKNFKRGHSGGFPIVVSRIAKDDFIEFYIANCEASSQNPGYTYIDSFTIEKSAPAPVVPITPNPRFHGWATQRVVEKFTRGVVAIPLKEGGVYVSWRLLEQDKDQVSFDVFRLREGKETKLNDSPIERTCDFTDQSGRRNDVYIVRSAEDRLTSSGEASASPSIWKSDENGQAYLGIKLADTSTTVQKVAVADLNGDGVYDFVIKTPNSSIDPWDRMWKPSTQTYKLSAYLSDGTHLWTKDLGWGIECGIWYSPYIVCDLNGDGRAEVIAKITDGDYRDKVGRVYEGPEYLAVFDGMTGVEIARAPWPSRDGFESYNWVSRNQLTMAYLDGKTPCVVALRGTYGTMKAEAWQLKEGRLESCWTFRNDEGPYAEENKEHAGVLRTDSSPKYYGQGAHSSIVADLDGDGRDDIVLGSIALNSNGDVLWSQAKGHNDWMILTDIIWDNPGQEIAYIYETPQSKGGICVVDAKTGKLLWENNFPSKHIHTGHAANFDPTLSGPEILGIDHDLHTSIKNSHWRFTNTGRLLSNTREESGTASNGIYWDADLEKEVINGRFISDYKGGRVSQIRGTPLGIADLFGDWREEIISSVPGELRIYATTIPAMNRRTTLMQNQPYRSKVLTNSQGYLYDPNLSYMPSFESDNFSLIFKPGLEGEFLGQVTVSASMHGPLAGSISLTAPKGVALDQSTWNVSLKPGEIAVRNIKISGTCSDTNSFLRGEFTKADGSRPYRAQAPLYGLNSPKAIVSENAIRITASSPVQSTGGTVSVVQGRPLAPDGCLIGWNNTGHKLSWQLTVPREGKYRLLIQYAANQDARRLLKVNHASIGEFSLEGTGGYGKEAYEWSTYTFRLNNGPLLLDLKAGRNELSLENVDNQSVNLAYLYLDIVQ